MVDLSRLYRRHPNVEIGVLVHILILRVDDLVLVKMFSLCPLLNLEHVWLQKIVPRDLHILVCVLVYLKSFEYDEFAAFVCHGCLDGSCNAVCPNGMMRKRD